MDQPAKSDKIVAHAVSLFEKEEPRALINLVPAVVAEAFEAGYNKRPDLFGMDERILRKKLAEHNRPPSVTENRLRMAFWQEYERAQALNLPAMQIANVVSGVCSKKFFYDQYLKQPENVAWILCIPAAYEITIQETLQFGLEKLRDMLELPFVDSTGRPNVKLMELQAKIVELVHIRAKGAVVQRNLNINASTQEMKKVIESDNMEDLNKRLKELERIEQKSLSQGNDKETFLVENEIVPPHPMGG